VARNHDPGGGTGRFKSSRPDQSNLWLHCQPLFPDGHEPEQPRVLVWGGVDSDDLDAIDVDLTEDFAQGFFPQLIAHRRVAPQRPELPQESREDRFGGGRAMSCGRPSMRLGSSKATCSSPARLPAVLLTVPPSAKAIHARQGRLVHLCVTAGWQIPRVKGAPASRREAGRRKEAENCLRLAQPRRRARRRCSPREGR